MARTSTAAALLVLLGVGTGANAASAGCSMSERMQMLEGGLNTRRVEELCGATEAPSSRPSGPGSGAGTLPVEQHFESSFTEFRPLPSTQVCASLLGPCLLPLPAPLGEVCWCSSAVGPVFGQTQ